MGLFRQMTYLKHLDFFEANFFISLANFMDIAYPFNNRHRDHRMSAWQKLYLYQCVTK